MSQPGVCRTVPWLCNAVRCCILPPGGRAGRLLAARHQVHVVQRCLSHSDSQEGHAPESACREDGQGGEQPAAPISTRPAQPLGGTRRSWGKSLSPLDRVSRMIPPEFVSQEVLDLQSDPQSEEPALAHLRTPQPPSSPQEKTSHANPADEDIASLQEKTSHAPLEDEVIASPQENTYAPLDDKDIASPQENTSCAPLDDKDIASPQENTSCAPLDDKDIASPQENTFYAPLDDKDIASPQENTSCAPLDDKDIASPQENTSCAPLDDKDIASPQENTSCAPLDDKDIASPQENTSCAPLDDKDIASPQENTSCAPLDDKDIASPQENTSCAPLDDKDIASPQENTSCAPLDDKDIASPQENTSCAPLDDKDIASPQENTSCAPLEDVGDLPPPQGTPFKPGDLLIAEYKRRHYSMFKKMFVLKGSGKLTSNWGAISSLDIVGKLPGQRLRTSTGHQFLLKRPSLEEYVIYMRRGPNISYPKDITAMMMMMDVSPGDVVLEAGSGSGALSLFLSRAVGSEGCVHSYEVRADHHAIAKKNFLKWKNDWQARSGRTWPDNVQFINKNILDALPDNKSVAFDAVALDMLNPHVALPAIIRTLKQGAVCVIYLANITQVIDLLEGIRSCDLPLSCEKVLEIAVTDWLVAPSLRKDGSVSERVRPQVTLPSEPQILEEMDDDESQTDEDHDLPTKAFGQVPYIARPMPWQKGHTAFLVQLRKFKPAPKHTDPGNPS